MARVPKPARSDEGPRAEGAAAWLRPTALGAFITAVAALLTAVYPVLKDRAQQRGSVLDTQLGRVSALSFGCSETLEVRSDTAQTVRLEVGTGRYPVSIQVFFKPDLADSRSFQMFPLPSSASAVNPMNIYTDGQAVLMSIAGGHSLYARYDPVTGKWDEFGHGYVYACALF